MKPTEAKFIKTVLVELFDVPDKSVKVITLGEGDMRDSAVMLAELVDGKPVTRNMNDYAEAVAYLRSDDSAE